jgi:hypothetical protein
MRLALFISIFSMAAAVGCSNGGSSAGSGSGGMGGAGDPCGTASCGVPVPSSCDVVGFSSGCTLDQALGDACQITCLDNCYPTSLVQGTRYSYVQVMNVDVAWVIVYDKTGMLVAELEWSAERGLVGCAWSCLEGPADFDWTEARSLFPVSGAGSLAAACAARARDAAAD